MNGFLGEYEVTLDAKGRFLLPASLKKQTGEEAGSFVINRGFEKCLGLYPMKSWEPIFEQISKLNDFDPKVRSFRRYFLNGATIMELDSAGRLLRRSAEAMLIASAALVRLGLGARVALRAVRIFFAVPAVRAS